MLLEAYFSIYYYRAGVVSTKSTQQWTESRENAGRCQHNTSENKSESSVKSNNDDSAEDFV